MTPAVRAGQRGMAMVTAIVLAIIVSVTAAVVLNLTFRRFELSAFRTDHSIAATSAEAGFQYAFARLDRDTTYTNPNYPGAVGFRAVVQAKAPAEWVVTCDSSVPVAQRDELVPALHMGGVPDGSGGVKGGKHLTVRILFLRPADNPPFPNRPYRVRSVATFGTGGQ